LQQINDERIATMQQLSDERIAMTKDLRDIATNERLALSRDIEQASLRVVDHAALRLAQIVAVSLVAIFIFLSFVMFLIRRWFVSPAEPRKWVERTA
jgi:hypothetical protein